MNREPHRAVLFDLFDTLFRVDETIYRRGKSREAGLIGVQPEALIAAWIEAADDAQTGRLPDLEARARRAASRLGVDLSEGLLRDLVAMEEETMRSCTSLYPDVVPTLESLRRIDGLKLALVSNASSVAEMLVDDLGLSRFFDCAIFSFRIGIIKPHPDIYLAACRAVGASPGACLFVGDGNGRELDGAKRVGMQAVRIERPVTPGPYRKEESVDFDVSIGALTLVPPLLRR